MSYKTILQRDFTWWHVCLGSSRVPCTKMFENPNEAEAAFLEIAKIHPDAKLWGSGGIEFVPDDFVPSKEADAYTDNHGPHVFYTFMYEEESHYGKSYMFYGISHMKYSSESLAEESLAEFQKYHPDARIIKFTSDKAQYDCLDKPIGRNLKSN